MFRVAAISRATLYSDPGGDTKQIERTAHYLRELGVKIDVFLTTDAIDYRKYDLLHFFNITRPADILRHTKKSDRPYVVSPIFVEFGHEDSDSSLRGRLRKQFGADGLEYLKVVARRVKNGERIGSMNYLIRGHRRSIQKIAQDAALLLPNSESEYRRFAAHYGVAQTYQVIPNGVDVPRVLKRYPKIPSHTDAVVCLGRIEPRKNQLRLIQALKGTGYKLIIHGQASPNHAAYEKLCREAAGKDCFFEGWLRGDEIFAALGSARVHAMPSFFETTGLSSLEAAAMGCNVVMSENGDTRDYFEDFAYYCDPEDIESIRSAVDRAYNAPFDDELRARIFDQFTWEHAAQSTLKAYRRVLRF